MMHLIRSRSDVVLMGASTIRTFRKPCLVTRVPLKKKIQPANAVVSSTLEGISPAWPFFTENGMKRILFVSERASRARIQKFEQSCEIIVLQSKKKVGPLILKELTKRGYSNVLVEGGGSLMWEFAQENLIDEYNVTLTPKIVGGSLAPTLVDGLGFSGENILNLKLKSFKKVGDEIYLVYRKKTRFTI